MRDDCARQLQEAEIKEAEIKEAEIKEAAGLTQIEEQRKAARVTSSPAQ